MATKPNHRVEFGDFQTPITLARQVCSLIGRIGFHPSVVIEPTCGCGSFIKASLELFPTATRVLGFEVNAAYSAQARALVPTDLGQRRVEIRDADFFRVGWRRVFEELPEPLLVLGNPPWVTNSELGALQGSNLPKKSNLQNLRGIDAVTGKSNFDISEWMLRENLACLNGRNGLLAVLCKTAVARKVLLHAWSTQVSISEAAIYRIDAPTHFGASVDACLLLVRTLPGRSSYQCRDYPTLDSIAPTTTFGLYEGYLIANLVFYDRWKHLLRAGGTGWRSGVKHDCARVFELLREGDAFRNGFGELVQLERDVVFPMLKSSDLARRRTGKPRRWMLLTQQRIREDTRALRDNAPKAWEYLQQYAQLLERRGSSIYKNRPPFSVFGVGPYTFAPWKVAIPALYKAFLFVEVPPFEQRPVVLDDTCYFFPCQSREECRDLEELVQSGPAQEFLSAFVFWDAKRPVTAQLLNLLDLAGLARVLGKDSSATQAITARQRCGARSLHRQGLLFTQESHGGRPDELD